MNPLKMGSAICSMMLQHLNSMEQCPWPLGALKKAKLQKRLRCSLLRCQRSALLLNFLFQPHLTLRNICPR